MIKIQFILSIEVEAESDAEAWREYNRQLEEGFGEISLIYLHQDSYDNPRSNMSRHDQIIPEALTIPCRDTMPCSGVKHWKKS